MVLWKYYYYSNSRECWASASPDWCRGWPNLCRRKRLRITIASNFKLWRNKSNCPTGPCCWQRIDSSCKCTDAPIDDGFNRFLPRFSKGNSGWLYYCRRCGRFYVLKRDGYPFKTIYDASTMVTSSRQINFWGKQAGASEAVFGSWFRLPNYS